MGPPLRTAALKQLGVIAKAFPLAPEDAEFSEEIRQMVVGRYRVLFTIKGRKVHVLDVREAYVGPIDEFPVAAGERRTDEGRRHGNKGRRE